MYLVRKLYPDGTAVYWASGGGWVSDQAHAQVFYSRSRAQRKARYERGAQREGAKRAERSRSKRDRKQEWSPRTYTQPVLPEFDTVDVVKID